MPKVQTGNNIFVDETHKKVIVRNPYNRFLGTSDNLWSNPANWSLGFLPTPGHIAVIEANCTNAILGNVTVKEIHVLAGVTLTNSGLALTAADKVDNRGAIVSSTNLIFGGTFATSFIGNITYNGGINQFQFTDEYVFPNVVLNAGEFRITQGTVNFESNVVFPGRLYVPPSGTPQGSLKIKNNITVEVSGIFDFDGNMSNKLQLSSNSKLIASGNMSLSTTNILSALGSEIISKGALVTINNFNLNLLSPAKLVLETVNKQLQMFSNTLMVIDLIEVRGITVDYIYNNLAHTGSIAVLDVVATITGSIWNNKCFLRIRAVSNFMAIGEFNAFFTDSKVSYDLAGNQAIRVPNDTGYKELRLEGSGVKSLTGNTSCELLYFSGTATLDFNGFTLGITNYTDVRNIASTILSGSFNEMTLNWAANAFKTLTGNIIVTTITILGTNYGIDYSGYTITATNFDQEYRQNNTATQNITGRTYRNITIGLNSTKVLQGNVVITNTCTITQPSTYAINLNGYTINFSACSTTYSTTGTQNILGGTYLNLTIGTAGVKTLQGNVVVTGVYSRTGTATINKNGYTIKDSMGNDLE